MKDKLQEMYKGTGKILKDMETLIKNIEGQVPIEREIELRLTYQDLSIKRRLMKERYKI